MYATGASFLADGSCRLSDDTDDVDVVWSSRSEWAADWFAEWRADESGPAGRFIHAACDDATPGVVDALVTLAESAQGDAELLSWVGAGPLEDLVSHSGNGAVVLVEVDRAARQNVAFRGALSYVWLGTDIPAPVKDRLVVLGARDLEART